MVKKDIYVASMDKINKARKILKKKKHVNGNIFIRYFTDDNNNYTLKEFRLTVEGMKLFDIKTEADRGDNTTEVIYDTKFMTSKKATEELTIKTRINKTTEKQTIFKTKTIFVDELDYDDIMVVEYLEAEVSDEELMKFNGKTVEEFINWFNNKIKSEEWPYLNFTTLVDGIQDRFISENILELMDEIIKNKNNTEMLPAIIEGAMLRVMVMLLKMKIDYAIKNKDKIMFGINDCIRFNTPSALLIINL